MITREQIKAWVVKKASVTNPYKKYWSASVTIGGMDVNETGDTIEKAYNALTDRLFNSNYYKLEIAKLI
jgi:hypothetical protein